MSELDKMMAFGTWLTTRQTQQQAELYSLSINREAPLDAIRIKAGHIEATHHILTAFRELFNGDLNKFNIEYLGKEPEEEDKESTDGPRSRAT